MRKLVQTGEFMAYAKTGESYRIVEYTHMIGFRPLAGTGTEWSPGLKEYRLSNGDPVNMISENEFFLLLTDVRVYRDRPA